jgi:hypothetical protein
VEGRPLGVQEHVGKVISGGVKVDAATILGREVVVGEGVVVRNCVVLPNKGINSDVSNEVISPPSLKFFWGLIVGYYVREREFVIFIYTFQKSEVLYVL